MLPDVDDDIADRVAAICSALPETTCRVDKWAYSYEIRKKPFCHLVAPEDQLGNPVPIVVVRADPEERAALLAIGTPYFASGGQVDRVGVVISEATDWSEISELITESYRIVAPKKLSRLLPEPSPPSAPERRL